MLFTATLIIKSINQNRRVGPSRSDTYYTSVIDNNVSVSGWGLGRLKTQDWKMTDGPRTLLSLTVMLMHSNNPV